MGSRCSTSVRRRTPELSGTAVDRGEARRLETAAASLRRRLRLDAGEAAVALRVVYAGTAAYAALFVFAAVVHYAVFETARVDLGNMVQAIWNTQHGHFLEGTTLDGHQMSRLGGHVDPFLLVFVPLMRIWPNPVLLPIFQALAVASGALPVFWLARKHLGSPRAGAHFAFAYLLYPATQFNAFTITSSFHSVAMAVPLVLYAIWFLDENRLVAFSGVALLAFTTKEEIPLAVGCLGIWYAVRRGRRVFGFAVFGVGSAVTLFNFLWLIPHFSPSGTDPFAHRYSAVGGTPQGITHKLFTDPGAFVHEVATGHKAGYLALLLVPFLGLWLLEPLLFLGAIPDLAINLFSNLDDQTSINFHWTGGIVPFVVAASIFGAGRFKGQGDRISLWAMLGTGCLVLFSPIYFGARDVRMLGSPLVSAKSNAVDSIPHGVPVSASNQLGGHLSGRRYIYWFPKVRQSRWIIVDVNDPTYGDRAGYRRIVRKYESDKRWKIVFSSEGVAVLHERASR
jgi:uncharacterized membrane protein